MGIDWENIPEKRLRQERYKRIHRNLPSPTILTSKLSYYHPTQNRLLTVREAAALQSFPNDFIFTGTLSSQWRQIGNAVPPVLAKALGDHLKVLCKKRKLQKVNFDLSLIRSNAFKYKNRKQQ